MAAAQPDEEGFTLVELMIVVGIIAILIAIMIPNFLQARQPAQDRQAQTALRTTLTATKTIETAPGQTATAAALSAAEPSLVFVPGSTSAPANQRTVSVTTVVSGGETYVILASLSTSGRCFAALETPSAEVRFQRVDAVSVCRADQFDTATGWTTAWP